jgi:hypothetical protein
VRASELIELDRDRKLRRVNFFALLLLLGVPSEGTMSELLIMLTACVYVTEIARIFPYRLCYLHPLLSEVLQQLHCNSAVLLLFYRLGVVLGSYKLASVSDSGGRSFLPIAERSCRNPGIDFIDGFGCDMALGVSDQLLVVVVVSRARRISAVATSIQRSS